MPFLLIQNFEKLNFNEKNVFYDCIILNKGKL